MQERLLLTGQKWIAPESFFYYNTDVSEFHSIFETMEQMMEIPLQFTAQECAELRKVCLSEARSFRENMIQE